MVTLFAAIFVVLFRVFLARVEGVTCVVGLAELEYFACFHG